jgi:hypothetical protein
MHSVRNDDENSRSRVGSSSTGPGPPETHQRDRAPCARPRPPGRNRPHAPIPGPIPPRPRRASTPLPRRDRPPGATSPHTVTPQRHLRRQRPLPQPAVPGTPTDRPPPRSARAPRATARSPPDRGSPPAHAAGPRTSGRPAHRCQTRAAAGPPTATAAGDCGDGHRGVAPADARGRGRGVLLAGDVRPQPLTSPASPRCPHPQPDGPHHRTHRGGSRRQRLPPLPHPPPSAAAPPSAADPPPAPTRRGRSPGACAVAAPARTGAPSRPRSSSPPPSCRRRSASSATCSCTARCDRNWATSAWPRSRGWRVP